MSSCDVTAGVDDMSLTCSGRPVCVGLWAEVRVVPPDP